MITTLADHGEAQGLVVPRQVPEQHVRSRSWMNGNIVAPPVGRHRHQIRGPAMGEQLQNGPCRQV